MDKYLIKPSTQSSSISSNVGLNESEERLAKKSKKFLEVDLKNLPADPGLRPQILAYHPNDRDEIRRAYMLKGTCQPRDIEFPKTLIGSIQRRFNPKWYDEFGDWLEYSSSKDAVFCLCCYLMGSVNGDQGGSGVFISTGFNNWKDMKSRLQKHVGGVNSSHNNAWRKCEALMDQKQHIEVALSQQSSQIKQDQGGKLQTVTDMADKWSQTALLVIDMQKDFVLEHGLMRVNGGKAIVPNVIKAVDIARQRRILVVWVVREHDPLGRDVELFRQHMYSAGKVGPISKGSVGAELVDGLVIKEEDYKLVKTRFSAFFATHLHSFLQSEGIKNLVVTGVQTPNCIRQTVFDAVALDYKSVTVIVDATAAATPDVHNVNVIDMKNIGVVTPTLEEWCKSDV